ncbi:uncharacterized protein SAMN05446037_10489 [Anaerovirgula multivorans]|uniref:Radical SAM core domain-containing protein n=1 Tax=Anaerovirgula multivorans TaxID=312168 RepID=A0A239KJN8_9FIRM|nr:radical SAM protein [Anaerovirgula multivorans]SNT17819.1 uncharacterized protein SAMN05446037_10489 [Anaerovirgula multivorans]
MNLLQDYKRFRNEMFDIVTFSVNGKMFLFDTNTVLFGIIDNTFIQCIEFICENLKKSILTNQDLTIPEVIKEDLEIFKDYYSKGVIGNRVLKEFNDTTLTDTQNVVSSLTLDLTYRCNMNCTYCFAEGGSYGQKSQDMSLAVAIKSVKALLETPSKKVHVNFFGGEPLLMITMIRQIIEYGNKLSEDLNKKITYGMTTNGLLLTKEIIEFCNINNVGIMISCDGLKEIQDKMRPLKNGGGSFAILERKMKLLNSLRLRTTVRGTIVKRSLGRLKDTYTHFIKHGFSNIHFASVSTPSCNSYGLDVVDYIEYFKELCTLEPIIYEELRKNGVSRLGYLKYAFDILDNKHIKRNYCGAGSSSLTVSPEGNCYDCHRMVGKESSYLGNILDENFMNNHAKAHLNNLLEESCRSCLAVSFCKGGCYAEKATQSHEIWNAICDFNRNMVFLVLKLYALRYLNQNDEIFAMGT